MGQTSNMTTCIGSTMAFALLLATVSGQSLPAANTESGGKWNWADIMKGKQPNPFFSGETYVKLNLYTQNNPTTPELILVSNASSAPSFNPKHPTRFVIHGWRNNGGVVDDFRKSYMETGLDFNVVIVDWEGLAAVPYSVSILYARSVGEWVAEVISHLVQTRGLNLDDVFVIGHSLGAQVAAVVGNRLNSQLAQVIGLDIAAYLFGNVPDTDRLDRSDAKQVQVIHTSGGIIGWKDSVGHVDFFPEGGSVQPNCSWDFTGTCSHMRALPLYVESIVRKDFLGTMCQSFSAYKAGECSLNTKLVMGEWTPLEASGNYYLKTSNKSPYSLGDIGL